MGIFRQNRSIPATDVKRPTLSQSQADDRHYLRQKFYESFDRSLVESMVYPSRRDFDWSNRVHPIGEGRHFRAAVLQPDTSFRSPVVLSQPKAFFLGKDPTRVSAAWLECMRKLKEAQLPLIPPFEVIAIDGIVRCLVTPFGGGGVDQVHDRWSPINDYVNLTLQGLRALRLEIDDYIQVRTFERIPFICDFSDLKSITNP